MTTIPLIRRWFVCQRALWFGVGLLFSFAADGVRLFPEGTWVIVDHKAPGISAMSVEEVQSQMGKTVRYEPEEASFERDVCHAPEYRRGAIEADDFLFEFRFPSESLGFTGNQIETIDVLCGGRTWASPAGRAMKLDDNRSFIVWDGVFFLLEKR